MDLDEKEPNKHLTLHQLVIKPHASRPIGVSIEFKPTFTFTLTCMHLTDAFIQRWN